MDTDAELMRRALALAANARRRTPPNPWVGCVLVRDGEVVGEGATQPPGGPHAEVEALRAAGDRAGAPPPTSRSSRARTRPYASVHRRADRRGRRPGRRRHRRTPTPTWPARASPRLREHGRHRRRRRRSRRRRARSLAPYLVHRALGRSFVVLKTATSLDGRIAARDGSSRWITGPAARADVHELRADSQAVDRRRRDRARRPAEPHRARHP